MKKIISVLLVLCLAFALVACGKSNEPAPNGDSPEAFVKPENYSSVLLVTINPQFRLYLDENGTVLAVEAVNDDAKAIKDDISFENENFETVVKNIVAAANEKGFVKEDATVSLEIVESKETNEVKTDILSKAENEVKTVADELKIEIKVSVTEVEPENKPDSTDNEENKNENNDTPETEPDENKEPSKPAGNQGSSSSKPDNSQQTSKPVHTHSFSAATCTEPKKCSCGAVEGKALGHDYKDGVCTRCNAKDPNYVTPIADKKGEWKFKSLDGGTFYSGSIYKSSGAYGIRVALGESLSSLPPEMQESQNVLEDCETYNGVTYFLGRGSGEDLKSVAEEGNTVTVTDTAGNKLVLTRTGENTMKCVSVSEKFTDMANITVGLVFTFVAD